MDLLKPVPLSLSRDDGSMQNTPKLKLMKYLESLAATDPPKIEGLSIIDVMFFLRHQHTKWSLPSNRLASIHKFSHIKDGVKYW